MKVLVSIIIPHFNRSALLKTTVQSVQDQTFKDWEIIIIDDGSDKLEFAKIKEYDNAENIKVIQRESGIKGPSSCRNLGVQIAKGKYLIFLDSDDLLYPFCLEQRIAIMERKQQINMAVFLMENFKVYPGDTKTNFNLDVPFEKLTSLFLRNNNPWQTMAPIWDKVFFESIGGFDEELLFMEDPELHLRAINYPNAKIKICYDKPADCHYRINHLDDTKKDFYYNSIFYRILFYKKIILKNNRKFLIENASNIKRGIYSLVNTFLYSRKNKFPQLYSDLISLMKDSKLFNSFEIKRLSILINVGNTQLWIARKLRLRGICYKLLPV